MPSGCSWEQGGQDTQTTAWEALRSWVPTASSPAHFSPMSLVFTVRRSNPQPRPSPTDDARGARGAGRRPACAWCLGAPLLLFAPLCTCSVAGCAGVCGLWMADPPCGLLQALFERSCSFQKNFNQTPEDLAEGHVFSDPERVRGGGVGKNWGTAHKCGWIGIPLGWDLVCPGL